MENIKLKLTDFFEKYKKEININELVSKFKVSDVEQDIFLDSIYELEQEGKIIGNDNGNYIHVPKEFYLYEGILKKSSKNNLYINLKNGLIVIIPNKNLNGAEENDLVYVDIKKSNKHSKQFVGSVVRIVKKPRVQHNKKILKTIIKKNYTKNFYYARIDNELIYIPDKYLNGAYPYDLVSIQIDENNNGKVVEILKRDNSMHVLEYKKINDEYKFVPIGTSDYNFDVYIPNSEKIELNDRILVDISIDNKAKFIKKIDSKNDLNSYITALFYDWGFNTDFSNKTLEEIKKISTDIKDEDINDRKDLRNLTTITIDGETAKDLDDAISLEFKDNKYYLYVHIADVSHYVKFGSSIFDDAYSKGTSVYPGNLVFPMLPKELSNGICSLNPNEDRLTKTCLVEFDISGNILDYSVFNSIIKSNYKMCYNKVNDILTNNQTDEDYKPFFDLLKQMNNLSNILQKKRLDRGFICFETDNTRFNIDENGDVESIVSYVRGPAEVMIENFMLVANEMVATIAFYYQLPFIYRVHEGPNIDQINKLKKELHTLKSHLSTIRNADNPKELQKILLTLCKNKDLYETNYLSKMMLHCMNRAYYDTANKGHYALALNNYATFTSPIRRFPDLLNHYIIEKVITGNLNNLDMYIIKYNEMYNHCTQTQMASEKFEKIIDNLLLKNYAENYIDIDLPAKIIFITNEFVYVRTNNSLYGTIPITRKCLTGDIVTLNNEKYAIGDDITVVIDKIKDNSDELLFIPSKNEKELVKKRKKEKK